MRLILVTYYVDLWNEEPLKLKSFIEMNNYIYICSGFWSLEDVRLTFFVKGPIFFIFNLALINVRDK